MKIQVASKVVEIRLDSSSASDVLKQELSLYPTIEAPTDFLISFSCDKDLEILAQNPTHYQEHNENIFTFSFPRVNITWNLDNSHLVANVNFLGDKKRKYLKWRSIQYTHPYEEIGQVFHELILVPGLAMFFSEDISIIHGSCVEHPSSGKATIIGGVGGVGKTSLEIELVLSNGFNFLTDDICFIDKKGHVWPNYAFPKIYGYNAGENSLV